MIEEVGIVTAIELKQGRRYVCIETQVKSTCGVCQAKDDCGTGIVARAFSPKKEQLWLPCDQAVEIGQNVKLGIPENLLLRASLLVYILPLVMLLFSSVVGSLILKTMGIDSEGSVILLAFLVASASFYGVRQYLTRYSQQRFEPSLLAVLPKQINCLEIAVGSG
ncbi:MAG: sigma-E factor negative regulatory protein RseC [Paraglaciecola sp.]|jgi:sigma-E factor negative regulatory protein RseC